MLDKQQALELARRHGYLGRDDPGSEAEEIALADALWSALEEREGRRLMEWHNIPRGAREIVGHVLKEY
jgi:hypothetical protein